MTTHLENVILKFVLISTICHHAEEELYRATMHENAENVEVSILHHSSLLSHEVLSLQTYQINLQQTLASFANKWDEQC